MTAPLGAFAGAGAVLVLLAVLAPWPTAVDAAGILLPALGAGAIALGIRRYAPTAPTAWWTLAGGLGLFAVGHATSLPALQLPPVVSDLVVLLAYPVLGFAALALVRAQAPGGDPTGDREGAIDGAIILVALATVFGGTIFAGPGLASASVLGWTLAVMGPLALGAIAVATLLLLLSGGTRVVSTGLLAAAATCGLASTVLSALALAGGSPHAARSAADGLMLVAYLGVGSAGLHPSMVTLTKTKPGAHSRVTRARLGALGMALLVAPVTLMFKYPETSTQLTLMGSVLLSLLILWRLGRLVSERDRVRATQHLRADRQSALAEIGLYALRQTDRQQVFDEALRISARLLDLDACQVQSTASQAVPEGNVDVPLVVGEHPVGRLLARRRQPLTDEDRAFLQAVANILAGVLQREETQNEMRRQAVHDPLTGLPNRTLLVDRLEHALARTQRSPGSVGVMFIDLDGFKRVNDDLGHHAGDELLRAVADRLRHVLRRQDTLARLSGDEFVVLCEHLEPHEVALIAQRIIRAMHRTFRLPGGEARVSASVGVALSDAQGGDPAQLLYQADAAMYHAKDSGGATFEVFDEKLGARLHRRRWLEQQLRGAASRGELEAVFQPLIQLDRDLGEIGLFGVETLLRWTHPTAGPISPGEFIPVADATGLIVPVGEWVLRQACKQLVAWRRELPHDAPFSVFVNISPRQLTDPDFPARVAAVLEETGADVRFLVLEVTETAILDDQGEGARTLKALRRMGLRIALDDFGTGYSSLTHLKRLPLDLIKVDASFVDGVGGTGEDRAIVAAVIGIARELGVRVVGEGVETEEQLTALTQLGCDIAQGYHLGKPLSPERVRPYLAKWERGFVRIGL